MMTPVNSQLVDVFIRGLPGRLGQAVDAAKPKSLDEAYEEAARLIARMDAKIIPDLRQEGSRLTNNPVGRGWNSPKFLEEPRNFVGQTLPTKGQMNQGFEPSSFNFK